MSQDPLDTLAIQEIQEIQARLDLQVILEILDPLEQLLLPLDPLDTLATQEIREIQALLVLQVILEILDPQEQHQ